MKKRLRRLIVFAGVRGLVMAVNVGAAFAVHDTPSPAFDEARTVIDEGGNAGEVAMATPGAIPVGSHILFDPEAASHNGALNGFFPRPEAGADLAIRNNPNCPLHYLP